MENQPPMESATQVMENQPPMESATQVMEVKEQVFQAPNEEKKAPEEEKKEMSMGAGLVIIRDFLMKRAEKHSYGSATFGVIEGCLTAVKLLIGYLGSRNIHKFFETLLKSDYLRNNMMFKTLRAVGGEDLDATR